MTLPADAEAYSTVFPEAIAKTWVVIATTMNRAKTTPVKRTSSPPFLDEILLRERPGTNDIHVHHLVNRTTTVRVGSESLPRSRSSPKLRQMIYPNKPHLSFYKINQHCFQARENFL
jgi:hypothetical protein